MAMALALRPAAMPGRLILAAGGGLVAANPEHVASCGGSYGRTADEIGGLLRSVQPLVFHGRARTGGFWGGLA
jgi:hypothetical protein